MGKQAAGADGLLGAGAGVAELAIGPTRPPPAAAAATAGSAATAALVSPVSALLGSGTCIVLVSDPVGFEHSVPIRARQLLHNCCPTKHVQLPTDGQSRASRLNPMMLWATASDRHGCQRQ